MGDEVPPGPRWRCSRTHLWLGQVVVDEIALMEWAAHAADGSRVEDGADSFVVRDGRIQAQTIHYSVQPAPRHAPGAGGGSTEVITMSKTVTLQVEGMTCAGCEHRLGVALHRVEGVYEATANHRTGDVRVRFDPTATGPEAFVERIVTAGYQVTGQSGVSTQ